MTLKAFGCKHSDPWSVSRCWSGYEFWSVSWCKSWSGSEFRYSLVYHNGEI